MEIDFAVVIPMANESKDFEPFVSKLKRILDVLNRGCVYFVIDTVSKDNTLALCENLSSQDNRFNTIWAPENRNVVDAYIRGYSEALKKGHRFIIEMDAGLSHDPFALPEFVKELEKGNDCVFGSRFIKGGNIIDSSWNRILLSKGGTFLSNLLLGTKLSDMTSGFQGFNADIVEKFVKYNLLSKAHFYQTELRYLLRKRSFTELPIVYRAPSPRVSKGAIINSIMVLFHYLFLRLKFKAPSL